ELLRFEAVSSGGISFEGEWFAAVNARMVGKPAQTPRMPLIVAANGPKGLAMVAERADGWVTTGRDGVVGDTWWSSVRELCGRLDDALAAQGREGIDRYLSLDSGGTLALESVDAWEDAVGRASALGFTDVIYHWPRAEGVYAAREE